MPLWARKTQPMKIKVAEFRLLHRSFLTAQNATRLSMLIDGLDNNVYRSFWYQFCVSLEWNSFRLKIQGLWICFLSASGYHHFTHLARVSSFDLYYSFIIDWTVPRGESFTASNVSHSSNVRQRQNFFPAHSKSWSSSCFSVMPPHSPVRPSAISWPWVVQLFTLFNIDSRDFVLRPFPICWQCMCSHYFKGRCSLPTG